MTNYFSANKSTCLKIYAQALNVTFANDVDNNLGDLLIPIHFVGEIPHVKNCKLIEFAKIKPYWPTVRSSKPYPVREFKIYHARYTKQEKLIIKSCTKQ